MKADVYQRVTNQIIASLETGIRPCMKPWSGEHAAGRITRPLRGNGVPYQGINLLMLWGAAMEKRYSAPIWLTFKQALGAWWQCQERRARQPCRVCINVHPHRGQSDDR